MAADQSTAPRPFSPQILADGGYFEDFGGYLESLTVWTPSMSLFNETFFDPFLNYITLECQIQVDQQLVNPLNPQFYKLWKSIMKQQQQQQQQQQQADTKLSWESLDNERPIPISLMTSFLLENIGQSHRKLERTQSETVTVKPSPSISVNTSRYKTELCRPYEESGSCKYGEKCQFAHGGHELRCLVRHPKYKTELCRTFHSVGFCPYGPRCHFIHNADEARSGGLSPRPARTASSPTSSLASSSGYVSSPPHSPPPSPQSPERLPVFNRISNTLLPMRFGSELIA